MILQFFTVMSQLMGNIRLCKTDYFMVRTNQKIFKQDIKL